MSVPSALGACVGRSRHGAGREAIESGLGPGKFEGLEHGSNVGGFPPGSLYMPGVGFFLRASHLQAPLPQWREKGTCGRV